MSLLELQKSVEKSLQSLKSLDELKRLFWSHLNYERVNKPLSRRGCTTKVDNELEEDPLLLASRGNNNDFHVIYVRFKSNQLSRERERIVVERLLQNHPYALFIFLIKHNHSGISSMSNTMKKSRNENFLDGLLLAKGNS